jgi:hypothetical protein
MGLVERWGGAVSGIVTLALDAAAAAVGEQAGELRVAAAGVGQAPADELLGDPQFVGDVVLPHPPAEPHHAHFEDARGQDLRSRADRSAICSSQVSQPYGGGLGGAVFSCSVCVMVPRFYYVAIDEAVSRPARAKFCQPPPPAPQWRGRDVCRGERRRARPRFAKCPGRRA